jgi:hypothetical protein
MPLETRIVSRSFLGLMLLIIGACDSSSARSVGDAGNGAGGVGGIATGVATGGMGAGQGGATASATAGELVDACLTYHRAQCERYAACGNQPVGTCLSESLECPDSLFSPGSNWTVALAKECAKQFATLPCEVARQWGRSPACAPAGTRAAGQTCTSDFQCQSQVCTRSKLCGVCAAIAKDGDDCASNTPCPVGSYCDKTLKCAPFPTVSTDPVKPGNDAGAALPTLGMACTDSCDGASYCDGKTCLPLPGKLAVCGTSAKTGRPKWCGDGLYCEITTGFCQPLPIQGEKCAVESESTPAAVTWLCASGLLCVQGISTPTCSAFEYQGCTSSSDCGGKLVCACRTGLQAFCRSNQCLDLRLAGETCDPDTKPCHPAFTCDNGSCVPLASQGVFTGICKK